MTTHSLEARSEAIFLANIDDVRQRADRLFLGLLLCQWVLAIVAALVFSPYAWAGKTRTVHFHVQTAVILGAAINALPIALILWRPGRTATRHTVAAAQMLWSAVLIHLTGGRIETHFHVFGSLAFLAFYRDWRILVTATVVVAADHLVRGLVWPESVYGIVNPEWWRFLEHATWVVFENIVLVLGCVRGTQEVRVIAQREASLERVNASVEDEVRAKTAELSANMARYKTLVEGTNAIPWEADGATLVLSYISPQVAKLAGRSPDELVGAHSVAAIAHRKDCDRVQRDLMALASPDGPGALEIDFRLESADGLPTFVHATAQKSDVDSHVRGVLFDVTQQKTLETELRHAQKLESVGRLAAGVAHEINTPVQFVSDSVHFVRDAMTELGGLIEKYRALHQSVVGGKPSSDAASVVTSAEEAADVAYLMENAPKALDRSIEGLNRVATIVRSMKEFAHPDQKEMTAVNINQAIQSTLTIARNEYKYCADVETDLGEIPMVTCHGGDVNQAVLNILVNASHAIADVVQGTSERGRIKVGTRQDGDSVVISISDTGGGIPDEIRERVFDPFFTTKEVGKGTGQGLAIARSIVMEKHGGRLFFETEPGKGTTFHLSLPIEGIAPSVAGVEA